MITFPCNELSNGNIKKERNKTKKKKIEREGRMIYYQLINKKF